MSLFRGRDGRATARAVSVVGAIGVSLAVAAASSGSAATFKARPARSARSTETATSAYALGAAPSLGADELIAYAPDDSYTYVAWNAPDGNGIDLCVIVPNTTSCEGGGPVELTDTAYLTGDAVPDLSGLTVLPSGEVVVLAASAGGGTGTYAWASSEGGAAFLSSGQGLQNGGQDISPVSLYYTEGNAVPLGGNDIALLDDSTHSNNYFSDSPYTGPTTPSTLPHDSNSNPSGSYPRKSEFATGPEVGAEAVGGKEIVVAVGDDYSFGADLPACGDTDNGTGYAYSIGTVGGVGAGSLNSEGIPNYSGLTCYALGPVLASGGSAGLGVLEEENYGASSGDLTMDYRQFSTTTDSFGSPVELQDLKPNVLDEASELDVAEDSSGGVYASWKDEQGLVLDYSANGGTTWDTTPIAQNALSNDATQGNAVIAAVGGGVGEIAYDNNISGTNEVYVQTVDFEPPAPTSVSTKQTAGTESGANLTINAGTAGVTDQATLSGANVALSSIGYVGGAFPGGTVTYNLYSNSTCTSKAKMYPEGTANVTAGVAAASSAVTASLKPGTYYWQASFAGNLANAASASACGSEKLTVAPVQTTGSGSASGASAAFTLKCLAACSGTAKLATLLGGTARAGLEAGKSGVLGKASFRLTKAGKVLVEVPLTKFGQKLLKRDHDKLTATLLLKTRADRKSYSTSSKLKLRK